MQLGSGAVEAIPESSFLGREIRAAAVVAAMAELEATLREVLIEIGAEINESGLKVRDLAPSLRSLALHSRFESLAEVRRSEVIWENRMLVTSADVLDIAPSLPDRMKRGPQPPLDGRTIESRHIHLVWQVLGLESPTPPAATVSSLKKLTQLRNDIAHANLPIVEVFGAAGRSAHEIARYLENVSDLILYLGTEVADYLRNGAYRAPVGLREAAPT